MIFEVENAMTLPALKFSNHAMTRCAQRGFRTGDAELIAAFGTEVEGGYVLRDKDVLDVESDALGLADRARQLVGSRLVSAGNRVITAYHATAGTQRRLLRNS